jgi:hypothetical protein
LSDPAALTLPSAYAPAERDEPATLRAQRSAFLTDPSCVAILEAMPGPVAVLNQRRQIVAANCRFAEAIGAEDVFTALGKRPGEAFDCIHSDETPGGCGTTEHCSTCGALNSILQCIATQCRVVEECRICTCGGANGGALDFRSETTPLAMNGEDFVVMALTDVSAEKRRHVLERIFFHDLLNECGGVHGLAELLLEEGMDPSIERQFKSDISRLSGAVIDEIQAHRQLLAAEQGQLQVHVEPVNVAGILDELQALYRHHPVAERREIRIGEHKAGLVRTDPVLLRRVLGNLAKNALEAVPPGGFVTISSDGDDTKVWFAVHNPGAMPERVRLQIFQRSFSTKAAEGRGIGTYSVKLLGERYLGGHVTFTSDEIGGTVFTLGLPLRGPTQAAA